MVGEGSSASKNIRALRNCFIETIMSLYLSNLDRLKNTCSVDWLAVSQERVYGQLKNRILRPGLVFIYLYGSYGVGKTFLGWLLDKERIVKYFVDLSSCKSNAPLYMPVFVDNIGADHIEFRRAMRSLEVLGIKKAVFVGVYPIEEDTPSIQLAINSDDIKQVRERLIDSGFGVSPKHGLVKNLWDLFEL